MTQRASIIGGVISFVLVIVLSILCLDMGREGLPIQDAPEADRGLVPAGMYPEAISPTAEGWR